MAELKSLYEKRSKIYKDLNDLRSRTRKEGKLEGEDLEQFNRWNDEYDGIDNLIKMEERVGSLHDEKIEGIEKAEKENPDNGKRYSEVFEKYIRYGIQNLSHEENQILGSNFNRAATASSTTVATGGYTIPEGFSNQISETMEYVGPFAGASGPFTPYNTPSGNKVPWPTIDDTSNDGYLLAESTDAQTSSTGFTFGEKELDAYVYDSSLIPVTIQLLQDSAFDFASVVGGLLGKRLGRAKNAACTTGTGSSQPAGVVTGANQGKFTASATAFTHDELLDFQASVDIAYQVGPKSGWMMHQQILAEIRKLDASTSNYTQGIWQPSFAAGSPDTILGKQYWINNDMASTMTTGSKILLYGDFSEFIIRNVGGVEMVRLQERFMEKLQVAFMGWIRFDSVLLQAGAVKYLDLT